MTPADAALLSSLLRGMLNLLHIFKRFKHVGLPVVQPIRICRTSHTYLSY